MAESARTAYTRWHNDHHTHPYPARPGFCWWRPDLNWWPIWLMERLGLAWNVRRPRHRTPPVGEP